MQLNINIICLQLAPLPLNDAPFRLLIKLFINYSKISVRLLFGSNYV